MSISSKKPLYYQLKQTLLKWIEGGDYPPGSILPSEKQLQDSFGISRTTVRMALKELEQVFDLHGLSKSPAIFDIEKLRWLNSEYIRSMPPEDFAAAAEPYIREAVKNPAIDPAAIAALLQQRTEVLTDIPGKLGFFDALPEYGPELFENKKSKSTPESAKKFLALAIERLETLPGWDDEGILESMKALAEAEGVKNAAVMWPVRIAVSGQTVTPGGAVELCRILGREETLARLRAGLKKLG